MSIIGNGSNVLVFDANGAPIACQKNVNVTFNDEVIDVTCKQSNGYSEFLPGKRNFSMTCEALIDWGQNLLLYSEEFNNAYWTKTEIDITANAGNAPDGTATADKIIPTIVVGTHQISKGSVVSSSVCTVSLYAKADGVNTIEILDFTNGLNGALFDLSNGTYTQSGTSTSSIENVGNGWYRCITTITTIGIRIYCPTSSGVAFGDGTNGVLIWGAQLNTGTTAQSYYQTTSTVNPNIDTLVSANLNRTKVELNIANPAFDDIYFNGEAYVESIEQNAGTEDVASYTVTFSGTGDLVSLVS